MSEEQPNTGEAGIDASATLRKLTHSEELKLESVPAGATGEGRAQRRLADELDEIPTLCKAARSGHEDR
jgi:hypothetical protein